MAPLRLGLIGLGAWGRRIARTLQSLDDVALVEIGRGDADHPGLDGVVIATPGASHAELALPYIERGIPTFIEKPMATSVADAERIAAAVARTGAIVFIGHIHLYNPAFRRALEILPTLGALRHMICEGMNNNPRRDCSVFWDWLPHHLSMARQAFGGDPATVAAWDLDMPSGGTSAMARFGFATGVAASVISWASPIKRHRITFACEGGTLVFDDAAETKLMLYQDNQAATPISHDPGLPLTCEMQAFLRDLRSGRIDPDQIASGLTITRLIAAAESSARSGGRHQSAANEIWVR